MFLQGYSIVEKQQGEMTVSHRMIAQMTDNKEETVSRLINKFYDDFEYFGNLRFKIRGLKRTTKTGLDRGIVEQKTYYLNEQQATLLLTYLRNSEIVREFKIALVEEFYKMRNYILYHLKYTKDGKNKDSCLGAYKAHTKLAYRKLKNANNGITKHWIPEVESLRKRNNDLYFEKERYKRELEEIKKKTKNFKY